MITIKTPKEIQIMRENGKLLASVIENVSKMVEPGITTKYLDEVAERIILKHGAKPNFKGYGGFPATLCTCVNEETVHCVPSKRKLKEGDILTLDGGLIRNGFHSDMAVTVPVGKISLEAQRLIKVTKKALKRGIKKVKPGGRFGDISNAIQEYTESQGFNIVRDFGGHGIGRNLHEDPEILNYGRKGSREMIKEGMVFCLEPIVSAGDWKVKTTKDGYGYQTKDGSLAAHFEHMIAVTKNGYEILSEL